MQMQQPQKTTKMEIIHSNMLPGMNSLEVEFYAVGATELLALHNRKIWDFAELPVFVFEIIRETMGFYAGMGEMKDFILQYYPRLDFDADISADGKMALPECIGSLGALKLENGNKLSASHLRVINLLPMSDKSIADTLCLSKLTVEGHFQSIRSITGFENKAELTVWASRKELIG